MPACQPGLKDKDENYINYSQNEIDPVKDICSGSVDQERYQIRQDHSHDRITFKAAWLLHIGINEIISY